MVGTSMGEFRKRNRKRIVLTVTSGVLFPDLVCDALTGVGSLETGGISRLARAPRPLVVQHNGDRSTGRIFNLPFYESEQVERQQVVPEHLLYVVICINKKNRSSVW
jgi:hypothetical protein